MATATTRIRNLPLFSGLRRSQVSAIDRLGVRLDVGGGRVLCREGEPGDEFFLLVDGAAGAQSSDGPVSILHAGAWFGELALLTGQSRSATVSTLTPATVIVFDAREFAAMLRIAPTVRARLERSAARILVLSRSTEQRRSAAVASVRARAGSRS